MTPRELEIRKDFIRDYGFDALNNANGNALAQLLFADDAAGVALNIRGMFTWLEFGDHNNNVPLGTFGSCRVYSSYGVSLDVNGNYTLVYKGRDHTKHTITAIQAEDYAKDVQGIILETINAVENAIANTGLNSIADYQTLQDKITGICGSHASNLYWNADGDLGVYLMKYLYILYPDKFSEYYSESKLRNKLNELGIVLPRGSSRLVKNGAIALR